MAIIQISRIQNRRGLQENLPLPLAAAELGWALDSQRLYIGNGSTADGAPSVGNTEILTEHSNITDLPNAYTFSGYEAGGYEVNTGPSSLDYKTRSIQNKLDDIVNIRDFANEINYAGNGGLGDGKLHGGDGIENDAVVFNRAITELHRATELDINARVRRTLHIPAGVYVLDDVINLLPFVKLKGEGKNATFIVQTNSNVSCAIRSVALGDIRAGRIEIEGMTILNTKALDVVEIDSTVDVVFSHVCMQRGSWTPGSSIATIVSSRPTMLPVTPTSAVKLTASITAPTPIFTNTILFANCDFTGADFGLTANGNVSNVNVINGKFTYLYRGCNIGDGSDPSPTAIKISHSFFDEITAEGIHAPYLGALSTNIVSAFNTFKEVGNFNGGTKTAIVNLGGANSYSISDVFNNRDINVDAPPVNLHSRASYAILPNGKIQLCNQVTAGGSDVTLLDDTTGSAGVVGYHVAGEGIRPTILEYSILRSTIQRTGILKITASGSNVTFEDDFVETADIGITLIPAVSGETIVLNYSVNSLGNNAVLKTTTRTLI